MTNKKRLGLAVPESLYEKILDKAMYQGKTLNSTCLDILWNYFEDNKHQKQKEGDLNG